MRAALPMLLLSVRPLPFAGAPRPVGLPLPAALAAPSVSLAPAPSLLPAAAPAPSEAPRPSPLPDAARAASEASRPFDGGLPAPRLAVAPDAPARAAASVEALRAAKGEDAEWLASVLAALRRSRTGRRVLGEVDALAARRGRPVMVDVARLSNNAEVRYDSGLLVMDRNLRRQEPALAAPIMAHELQHVLQKAVAVSPADALEMEIESYTVEARVWDELGLVPPEGSFARQAKTLLQKDPDAFFGWLGEQYKTNRLLHGGSLESYIRWLEQGRERALRRAARQEKAAAEARRVLAAMAGAGVPAEQVEAHRHDELLPAEARLRETRLTLKWLERDLGLLSTPEGRKRFRDYSRGVIRRARALSRG